jgi:hypothetical protein
MPNYRRNQTNSTANTEGARGVLRDVTDLQAGARNFTWRECREVKRMMRMVTVLRRQFPVIAFAIWLAGGACDDKPSPPSTPGPTETFNAADGTRFGAPVMFTGLDVPWSLAFTSPVAASSTVS